MRQAIFSQLLEKEQKRYLDSLIDDSIEDDMTDMRDRLLIIARHRYKS